MSCRYQFRVVLIGDSTVGKTSLLYRLKDETGQLPNTTTTFGIDFHTKAIRVNGVDVNLQLWDTAGQEDFRSITVSFFRNAIAALLVFDVTKRESFYHLNQWISEAKSNCHPDHGIVMLLVGNKADLEEDREVTHEEAKDFALQHDMDYIETSAMSGANVQKASVKLTETLLSMIDSGELAEIRMRTTGTSQGLQISTAASASMSMAPVFEDETSAEKPKQRCCQKSL